MLKCVEVRSHTSETNNNSSNNKITLVNQTIKFIVQPTKRQIVNDGGRVTLQVFFVGEGRKEGFYVFLLEKVLTLLNIYNACKLLLLAEITFT